MLDRSTRGCNTRPGSNRSAGSRASAARSDAKSCATVVVFPVTGVVVAGIPPAKASFELVKGVGDGLGERPCGWKPADVAFDAAILVGAGDAGEAVERIEPVVERNSTQRSFSTRPCPRDQDVFTAAVRLSYLICNRGTPPSSPNAAIMALQERFCDCVE